MIYKAEKLKELYDDTSEKEGGFSVIPTPDFDELIKDGAASIDLRLGRWFITFKQSSTSVVDIVGEGVSGADCAMTKRHFVPFGGTFVLHPGRFVLASTLEWLTLPSNMSGYVTGKSSLGRRGLIVETASGIHPGFSGCLTLELANVGEVPVAIQPGMKICQVFIHDTTDSKTATHSAFSGQRRPTLGRIKFDPVLEALSKRA